MRAKINHGNRGTEIGILCRRYGFELPYQYWRYILDQFVYGNFDQAIDLFNAMKGESQKSMLLNLDDSGESFKDFIIENL